ncbi:MAG: hypothetical protein EA378_06380 [Phycisphaerales bacterium]|nr:MAG: hypothetical protein EA378_06380 [Phycisphaerales bacterium]
MGCSIASFRTARPRRCGWGLALGVPHGFLLRVAPGWAWLGVLAVAACGVLAPAHAQTSTGQPPSDAERTNPGHAPGEPGRVALEDLPPIVQVAARSENLRSRVRVVPTVVLVPDASTYVFAVGSWRFPHAFPVLIDDGSPGARADIARFVRAFQPERLVRWTGETPPLPDEPEALASFIDSAVATVWGLEGDEATSKHLLARWRELNFAPAGVVVANAEDEAWAAALPLAALRGQAIFWHPMRRDFGGAFDDRSAWQVDDLLRRFLDARTLAWEGIGTGVDTITLCANTPPRVRLADRSFVAMTDLLGRTPPEGHAFGEARDARAPSERWAYASQIHGSASQAAYRAMCGLFLVPERAWVYDGYPDEAPWNEFSGARAAETLRGAGLRTDLDRRPDTGARAWGARASGGLEAQLVLVNSHGMPDAFDLGTGTARAGDVPTLRTPAAVHFVHSWSMGRPGDRETIGPRWLENGAFAYVGSVQEPYLTAFVPTPLVARRLAARVPWAIAVRLDQGPVWRVATIGDALWCVGPPAEREAIELRMPGLVDVEDELREQLGSRDLAGACATLVLLGREGDAVRLYERTVRQDEIPYDAGELASIVIDAVFRTGDPSLFVEAFRALPADAAQAPSRRDMLWERVGDTLANADEATINLMVANVRDTRLVPDAQAVVGRLRSLYGPPASVGFLRSLLDRTNDGRTRERLEAMLEREELHASATQRTPQRTPSPRRR